MLNNSKFFVLMLFYVSRVDRKPAYCLDFYVIVETPFSGGEATTCHWLPVPPWTSRHLCSLMQILSLQRC